MSLSVKPNSDGTFTVTCAGVSVTVGTPTASDKLPEQDASDDDGAPVLWPNGGATASIIAGGKAKTKIVRVPSAQELLEAIKEQHGLHQKTPKPTIFQFHVGGAHSLSVDGINKALADLGNPDWMGTQFKWTGHRDE